MAERVSANVQNQQHEALEKMVNDGQANNKSEALRIALGTGLRKRGYLNGYTAGKSDTSLRAVVRELARLCAYSGIGYAAIAVAFPVVFLQQWVLVLLLFALGFLVLDQLLESHEPAVSRRLFGWAHGREVRADGGGER